MPIFVQCTVQSSIHTHTHNSTQTCIVCLHTHTHRCDRHWVWDTTSEAGKVVSNRGILTHWHNSDLNIVEITGHQGVKVVQADFKSGIPAWIKMEALSQESGPHLKATLLVYQLSTVTGIGMWVWLRLEVVNCQQTISNCSQHGCQSWEESSQFGGDVEQRETASQSD